MPLLKGGKIVEDAWTLLADDLELSKAGFVVVSLDRAGGYHLPKSLKTFSVVHIL